MFEKFRNRYRIASSRLPNWDYGSMGAYFITICTRQRQPYFGHITQDDMVLSRVGDIIKEVWMGIPYQFNYIRLDEFIIMPDHVHGILVINKQPMFSTSREVFNSIESVVGNDVETRLIASLHHSQDDQSKVNGGITGQKNPMLHDNIPRVIRWFKGRCTFEIRKTLPNFGWQPRFHDHLIRSRQEMFAIRMYIKTNAFHHSV